MKRSWALLTAAVLLMGACVPVVALGKATPEVEAAVHALIEALKDPDGGVREAAAEALRAIGAKETIPLLIEVLKAPEEQVRSAAAEALGAILGQERR